MSGQAIRSPLIITRSSASPRRASASRGDGPSCPASRGRSSARSCSSTSPNPGPPALAGRTSPADDSHTPPRGGRRIGPEADRWRRRAGASSSSSRSTSALQGFLLTQVPVPASAARALGGDRRRDVPLRAGRVRGPVRDPDRPYGARAPFLPALMAAIYRLLGPTLAAGYATWLVVIAIYGAMYGMLPWLGASARPRGGAGLAAGLVGALIPRWPGFVEAPAGVAIGLMLAAFLARWEGGGATAGRSLALGARDRPLVSRHPVAPSRPLGLLASEVFACGRPRRARGRRARPPRDGARLRPLDPPQRAGARRPRLRPEQLRPRAADGEPRGGRRELEQSASGGTERHPRTNEAEARKVQGSASSPTCARRGARPPAGSGPPRGVPSADGAPGRAVLVRAGGRAAESRPASASSRSSPSSARAVFPRSRRPGARRSDPARHLTRSSTTSSATRPATASPSTASRSSSRRRRSSGRPPAVVGR